MMKRIPGYEEYRINENGVIITPKGHVIRPASTDKGYLRVALENRDENGNSISRDNLFVHRLVAKTFIPNPDNLPVVMHLDNDPLHCHVSNLKWGTQKENREQADRDGLTHINYSRSNYIYDVYNDDESEVIKCNGCEGVADLLGYTNPKSVRPGKVLSGKYKGYNIRNTHERARKVVSFIDRKPN